MSSLSSKKRKRQNVPTNTHIEEHEPLPPQKKVKAEVDDEKDADMAWIEAASDDQQISDDGGSDDDAMDASDGSDADSQDVLESPETANDTTAANGGDSLRSNFFRMQVDSLLSEVKFTKQQQVEIGTAVGEIFGRLNEVFAALPPELDIPLTAASTKASGKKTKGKQASVIAGELIRAGLHFYGQIDGEYQLPKPPPKSKESVPAPVFQFRRPKSLSIAGSFATRTAVKFDANVDIIVELPVGFIRQKDAKDFKYHQKRLLFMLALAELFQKHANQVFGGAVEITATSFTRDCYGWIKPIVTVFIHDKNHPLHGMALRFLPSTTFSSFKPNKTRVDKVNLSLNDAIIGHSKPLVAFQHALYNTTINQDICMLDHARYVAKCLAGRVDATEDFPAPHARYIDTSVLLKTWLTKRQALSYGSSVHGGGRVSGFVLQMILAHLIASNKVTRDMSVLLQFKHVLQVVVNFGGSDLSNTSTFFYHLTGKSSPLTPEQKEMWLSHFEVVILDEPGQVNLTANLTIDDWLVLIEDARQTLSYLDSDLAVDNFEAIFGLELTADQTATPVANIATNYDLTLRLDSIRSNGFPTGNTLLSSLLYGRLLHSLLRRSLSPRHSSIVFMPIFSSGDTQALSPSWSLSSGTPPPAPFRFALVGLRANTATWKRLLDSGPAAQLEQTQEIQDYLEFWGSKAHQRQFKDGRLQYCVVWEAPESSRHLISLDIARYILQRHCEIEAVKVTLIGEQLDTALQMLSPSTALQPKAVSAAGAVPSAKSLISVSEAIMTIDASWNTLLQYIMALGAGATLKGTPPPEELPLRIRSCRLVHSAARRTTAVVPQPIVDLAAAAFSRSKASFVHPAKESRKPTADARTPTFSEPLLAILQFDSSGAWPDAIAAIANVKRAFFLKLANGLRVRHSINSLVTNSYLDVFLHGYVFRIDIFHPREVFLYQKLDSAKAKRMQFEYEERVRLTSSLKAVHDRNQAFGATAALVKRWLSAHMIPIVDTHQSDDTLDTTCATSSRAEFNHLPELAVDILTATAFSQNRPSALGSVAPRHHLAGFLRVLKLLSSFDFSKYPLVVDLDNSLSGAQFAQIQKEYEACLEKHGLQNLYLVYSSNVELQQAEAGDETIKLPYMRFNFGSQAPSAQILHRVAHLAKQTHDYLAKMLFSAEISPLDLKEQCMVRLSKVSGNLPILTSVPSSQKIFIPSYNDFDVVIKLNKAILTRGFQNIAHLLPLAGVSEDSLQNFAYETIGKLKQQFIDTRKTLGITDAKSQDQVLVKVQIAADFDPAVEALNALAKLLPHLGQLFFDVYGGNAVGVSWLDGVFEAKQNLRLNNMRHSKIQKVQDGNKTRLMVQLSMDDILADIQTTLGPEVIEQIVLVNSPT